MLFTVQKCMHVKSDDLVLTVSLQEYQAHRSVLFCTFYQLREKLNANIKYEHLSLGMQKSIEVDQH